MAKGIEYYRSKLTALRNATDELLKEMEEEETSSPKQRQNRRAGRMINFDAQYNKKKKAQLVNS